MKALVFRSAKPGIGVSSSYGCARKGKSALIGKPAPIGDVSWLMGMLDCIFALELVVIRGQLNALRWPCSDLLGVTECTCNLSHSQTRGRCVHNSVGWLCPALSAE